MQYLDATPIIGEIIESYPGDSFREAAFWCGVLLEMAERERRILNLIDGGNGEG